MRRETLGAVMAVVMTAAVFSWLTGCQRSGRASGSNSGRNSADEVLQAKLGPFIECINRTDSSIQQNAELYLESARVAGRYADPRHKPQADEWTRIRFISFKVAPYERNNEISLGCAADLEKAVAAPPVSPELDRIGREYAATLRELIPIFNQIDKYYSQKDYQDDRFSRGRALDVQVTPPLRRILSLSDALRNEVGKQNDALHQQQLDAAAKAGHKDQAWYASNFMLRARYAMEGIGCREELEETTLLTFEKSVQEAFDAAEAYGAVHPNERDAWYGGAVQVTADLFLKYLKELRRNVSSHASRRILAQNRETLLSTYNSLVHNYNTMR